MYGSYLLLVLFICSFAFWPEETANALRSASMKIQIYYVNYKMKYMAWRMYHSLKALCRESNFPEPGPFRFVDIWDREPLD